MYYRGRDTAAAFSAIESALRISESDWNVFLRSMLPATLANFQARPRAKQREVVAVCPESQERTSSNSRPGPCA